MITTVRFAPEPSGYLHLGHAKAIYLNLKTCKTNNGEFILRIDDTNPDTESDTYVNQILQDMKYFDINISKITYSSQYFQQILSYCIQMINDGNAYLDDTPDEIVKSEREQSIESKNRNNNVVTNKEYMDNFMNNDKSIYCIRVKIDMISKNKCLRDPVIYRRKNNNIYPTYDFACTIIDNIENITHVFRDIDYDAHNDIYKWLCKVLRFKVPKIKLFSRIKFPNITLSKRKMKELVNNKTVDGWDDPRLITIQNMKRMGLKKDALYKFIDTTGNKLASTNDCDWNKLWSFNKKTIDQFTPKLSCIRGEYIRLNIIGNINTEIRKIPLYNKNLDLGYRNIYPSNNILVEKEDLDIIKENNFRLLHFVNIEIVDIKDDVIDVKLCDNQDIKYCKNKIHWLSNKNLINIDLVYYDKLDKIIMKALTDDNIHILKSGDSVQFERKTKFFIYDSDNVFINMY